MEHLNEHDHGKAIVDHHGHQIVDGGDARAGGHGGVNVDLVEKHRDDRTDQARNDHRQKQRQTYSTGNRKGISVIQSFCKVQIKAYTYKRQCAKQKSVCSAYPHFL